MPGFKYVTENGVRGKYLKPAFPSLTSPCHTTIATGKIAKIEESACCTDNLGIDITR